MERIIDVYYARDNLPYKDEARTIHFPVAGSEFLGASQTTTIRFHYEQIGTDENVYTVESKRPDGKTGSQLLSKNTTEHYAEMSLSGWYSECKGDLFLSLKVYRGGTTATYNETTQLWEVNGIPVIESTGAIKLAINYTPMGRYENYEDAVSTFQQVLAALGDKLDTIKGIVGVSGLSQVDTTEYEEGQLFFDVDTKNIYKLESGEFVKINNKLEIIDVSGQTYQELLDKYGTQPFMSYFGETNNISVYQFKEITGGYELHCSSQKNGLVHIPSVVLANTFSTSDFTQLDFQSAPVVELQNDVGGTLSDLDYEKVLQPNATIKLGELYFVKAYEEDNLIEFWHYFAGNIPSNSYVGYHNISISKQNKNYRVGETQELFYDKSKIDQLLSQKQDTLDSGTNIKTINGESLLGSGNIVIQGGSGDAEWGSIGGDIADQTDLENEFQEVREIATGRTRSAIISYLKVAPTEQTFSQIPFYDLRGNRIETWSDFVAFVNGRTFANSKFNSQNDDIEIDYDEYIIFDYNTSQIVYRGDEAYEVDTANGCLNEGDIIIVKETTDQQGETIPDRWVYISDQTLVCSKLETSKVDLDNYSTKTETSTEVNKVAHDIAVEYNENTLYGSGDLCIKDKLLYKCNTNNTTGTWDSTKWDLTTVNSELGIIKGNYAKLDENNTFSGQQNRFTNGIESGIENDLTKYSKHAIVDRKFVGISLINAIYNFPKSENGTFTIATADQIDKINNNFAPTYDSTATYSVGDLCIYRGTLYKCITAISTAEEWNSTHWTAISVSSGFARQEQGFNVINASDIKNNQLSPEQYDLITNGKPTRINGELLGIAYPIISCPLITGTQPTNSFYCLIQGHKSNQYTTFVSLLQINVQTKVISLAQGGQAQYLTFDFGTIYFTKNVNIGSSGSDIGIAGNNVAIGGTNSLSIKGKAFPAYPTTNTSPQVLTIGAKGGSLSWVDRMNEWYGTQAQYDALGTYDSNTIYNILES